MCHLQNISHFCQAPICYKKGHFASATIFNMNGPCIQQTTFYYFLCILDPTFHKS